MRAGLEPEGRSDDLIAISNEYYSAKRRSVNARRVKSLSVSRLMPRRATTDALEET
jgi:hypothetical protein